MKSVSDRNGTHKDCPRNKSLHNTRVRDERCLESCRCMYQLDTCRSQRNGQKTTKNGPPIEPPTAVRTRRTNYTLLGSHTCQAGGRAGGLGPVLLMKVDKSLIAGRNRGCNGHQVCVVVALRCIESGTKRSQRVTRKDVNKSAKV